MESKDKTAIKNSRKICSLFVVFIVILQLVLFASIIFIAVPYQVDINNKQIMEMLAKFDKEQLELYQEQGKLRSEIDEIKKSMNDENIKKQKPELVHASRTKRDVQANGSIRKFLVKILGKLNVLESRVNRRSTSGFSPFLMGYRGLRGPRGARGEKGEKGDHADNTGSGSTTFIRWGKTTCPNTNGTTKIYPGRIGGQHYTQTGGTSSNLCLHMKPKFGKKDVGDTLQRIYGTEYELSTGNPFHKNLHDHDAVCVVCRVNSRGSKLIVNGRNDCPSGWTLEYSGYLMSEHYGHKGRTAAICVDIDADGAPGTYGNLNGNLLYVIQGVCGALPCKPYVNMREITCAVCTK